MKEALFLLSFVALGSGCAVHSYVDGTASYTATPPLPGASGASPLQAVMCVPNDTRPMILQVGDRCVLTGPVRGVGKVNGGTARLATTGECVLPYGPEAKPMRVDTATFQRFGGAVDVTLGGAMEGSYVTYRFTGTVGADAPTETCEALRRGLPPEQPLNGASNVNTGHEAWKIRTPEPGGGGKK